MMIQIPYVNHHTLSKHHLTGDSKLDDILKIVNDISGLHATSATTPYISLFARTKKFDKGILNEELYKKRNLGKIRCVRKTVYIHTKNWVPVFYSATKKQFESVSEKHMKHFGVKKEEYDKISREILKMLEGRGMTTKEVGKVLDSDLNLSAILNMMCDQGLLIRGEPEGGWRSNLHTYYRFSEYFPNMDLKGIERAKARRAVVRRYISSFGPVSLTDISWWTGFPKKDVNRIVNDLEKQVTHVRIDGMEGEHVMLSSDLESMKSIRESHLVNFLPGLDPYLMGYKDRDRYLDKKWYWHVFDRAGNSTNTILLNGRVIGVWDFEEKAHPLIKLHLFEEIGKNLKRGCLLKAYNLGRFIADRDVEIKECADMTRLDQRSAGSVLSPLKDQ